jgi:hypothetical protein
LDWKVELDDPDLGAALADGASDAAVRTAERELGCTFPADYRQFLLWRDGGTIDDGRVVLFSAAPGEFPDETLRAANLARPGDAPLLLIGYDERIEFGFRKSDLAQGREAPAVIYTIDPDGGLAFAAPSFATFLRDLARRVATAREHRARPWWKRWFGRFPS